MRKPTYEEQNAWISKYVAPAFLDLNFRPIIDATIAPVVKSAWEKYVTIPGEIRAFKRPEVRKGMEKAGVYRSLERLNFEGSMGRRMQILTGTGPENQRSMALLSNPADYIKPDGSIDFTQLGADTAELWFELHKKPLEVLEARIQSEIKKCFDGLKKESDDVQFIREGVIRQLLQDYNKHVKPADRDPLFAVHARAFGVKDANVMYNMKRD